MARRPDEEDTTQYIVTARMRGKLTRNLVTGWASAKAVAAKDPDATIAKRDHRNRW